MNARAYLQKQGWRGDGHSLDKTDRGIKKPLLVSKKVDVLGVGLNKHAAVSDQWWLRAFDESLKNFGSGQESVLATVQKHGIHRGGLYGRFVQGQSIAGTFSSTPSPPADRSASDEATAPNAMAGSKRKRDEGAVEEHTKDDIQHASKKAKKAKKAANTKAKADQVESAPPVSSEDKSKVDTKTATKPKIPKEQTAPSAVPMEDRVPAEKRALYLKRAAEKGLSLDEYIKRREEKKEEKKQARVDAIKTAVAADTTAASQVFGPRLRTAISEQRAIELLDSESGEIFKWQPGQDIPLDPRLWIGEVVKDLPRPIREARRQWMANQRDARKARRAGKEVAGPSKPTKADREKKRVARQEGMAAALLRQSRKALLTRDATTHTTIDGIENIPLVQVQSTSGKFTKMEMGQGRRVAKRMLRTERKQEKLERKDKKKRKIAMADKAKRKAKAAKAK